METASRSEASAKPIDFAVGFLVGVIGILRQKNADYGDSAFEPVRIFSRANRTEQLLVRLDDKLSRVARGGRIDREVLTDIVGYCALLAAALQLEGDAER